MEDPLILSGKRKRVSRLVTVQGHPIFKSNMYSMETGEKSVWDQELQHHSDTDTVEPDVGAASQPKVGYSAVKKRKSEEISREDWIIRKVGRYHDHNQSVKRDMKLRNLRKRDFIRANWNLLSPFLDQTEPPEALQASNDLSESSTQVNISAVSASLPLKAQPTCLSSTVNMRDYQLQGLNWLINAYRSGVNVILGDEMGLGKTLQTISFLGWLKFEANIDGPFLIVVPLSVLSNWVVEFKRFLPQMRVLKVHSADLDERDRLKKALRHELLSEWDVIVTTYDMTKNKEMKHALISSVYWRVVILDEGHVVRNENAQISAVVRRMHFEHAVLLTGTPLQNNLHELWSLLNFLHPDIFCSAERFDRCFNISNSARYVVDRAMLLKVHSMLKPFMLRRIKADVEKTVPPKVEKKVLCPLTPIQAYWYKKFLLKDSSLLIQFEFENVAALEQKEAGVEPAKEVTSTVQKSRWRRLQMLFMQLRKVCNHPFLIEEADSNPTETDRSIIDASGKLQVLDRLLLKLQAAGHRVVIFSQFTSILDILSDYLQLRGFRFCRLDGSTNRVQRQISINSFNAPKSPIFAFLLSTRAGGLGVNLQTADTVILYDSDWNPQQDLQAMARVHRIGQKKVVHVYRLISEGTIEERMVQRAEKKLYLDQIVNRDGVNQLVHSETEENSGNGLGESDLLDMLQFGADEICNAAKVNQLSDMDIDRMIDRCSIDLTQKTSGRKSARDFNPVEAPLDSRTFQGQHYDKYGNGIDRTFLKNNNNVTNVGPVEQDLKMIAERSKRERTSRLVEITDSYGAKHQVLKNNTYSIEEGESSVFNQEFKGCQESELSGLRDAKKRHVQMAGRDFENEDQCLICWDGGSLVLCDRCPAAYHASCLGFNPNSGRRARLNQWSCPHHQCMICERKAAAAGGLIFRCSECVHSFCEDHLPYNALIVGKCPRMEKSGYVLPTQACYIYCSPECRSHGVIEEDAEECTGVVAISKEQLNTDPLSCLADEQISDTSFDSDKDSNIAEEPAGEASMGLNITLYAMTPEHKSSLNEKVEDHDVEMVDDGRNIEPEAIREEKTSRSFVAMLDSLESGSRELDADTTSAKFHLALLRYGLPPILSELRCESCLVYHGGKCCVLAGKGIDLINRRQGDPDINQMLDCTMPLEKRQEIFLCAMHRNAIPTKKCSVLKPDEIGILALRGKHKNPTALLNFRAKCKVWNFGEVLISLLDNHAVEQRLPADTNEPSALVITAAGMVILQKVLEAQLLAERVNAAKIEERRIAIVNFVFWVLGNPGPQMYRPGASSGSCVPWLGYHGLQPFSMQLNHLRSEIRRFIDFGDMGLYELHKEVHDILLDMRKSGFISFTSEDLSNNSGSVVSKVTSKEEIVKITTRDCSLENIIKDFFMRFIPPLGSAANADETAIHNQMHTFSDDNPVTCFLRNNFPENILRSGGDMSYFLPPSLCGSKENGSLYLYGSAKHWLDCIKDSLLADGRIVLNSDGNVRRAPLISINGVSSLSGSAVIKIRYNMNDTGGCRQSTGSISSSTSISPSSASSVELGATAPSRAVPRSTRVRVSYIDKFDNALLDDSDHSDVADISAQDTLNEEEVLIDQFLGYRGDAHDRKNMDFLIRYKDETMTELWHPYSDELISTMQFAQFVEKRPALTPLLYSAQDAIAWRKSVNEKKITEVKPGDVAFVDLRCYGSAWYNRLNLPDSDTKSYVVRYSYRSLHKGAKKINVVVPIFQHNFAVDHHFVRLFGSVIKFDPTHMILVDKQVIRQFPAILLD